MLNDDNASQPRYTIRYQPASGILSIPWAGLFSLMLLVAIGAFAGGYLVATMRTQDRDNSLSLFWEAHDILNREFYFAKPSEDDQIKAANTAAIQAVLTKFNDPYTIYLPPVEAEQVNAEIQGETGGIGASVAQNEQKELIITEVRIGWPAEIAGMKAGDVIVAVNGQNVEGKTLNDVVTQIRGKLGTEVEVTVKRAGSDEPITLSMKREQINVYAKMLDNNVAYLSLSIFSKDADQQIIAQLTPLLEKKPRALIFDLRGNPGGYLDQAVKVADVFLTAGKVASEKTSDGESTTFNADDGDIGEQIPMVVLVNGGSASASEIVAGALKDRGRAVLIGVPTFGKGSVQTIHQLSDGSQLRVTHGAWYTPNETPIQKDGQHIGLQPDVTVTIPDDPTTIKLGDDPFLDAARAYIDKTYPESLLKP
ncbi:MAG: S41 family peptidase [Anaerolineae bacterium]|nr:S41 family peptidase [Anaerolineae bacterium]